MPIKFRCQHCQQFLGISKSRAGAIVDCPQCGRNLRVPDLDGRVRKLTGSKTERNADSALISALSELSALGHSVPQRPPNLPMGSNATTSLSPARRDSGRTATKPIPAAELIELDTDLDPQVVRNEPIAIFEDETTDRDPLEELAGLHGDFTAGPVSESLLTEMRSVSQPISSTVAIVFKSILMIATGLVAGWYLGRMKTTSVPGQKPGLLNAESQQIGDRRPKDEVSAGQGPSIFGTVTYLAADGTMAIDAGAIVVALPPKHPGTVKLSARGLHLPPDHPDHRATVAMLKAYGGQFAKADSDGRFTLNKQASADSELVTITVSKHLERAADLPVSQEAADLVDAWFDSASHFSGRLAIQVTPLNAETGPFEIRIAADPHHR